MTYPVPLRVQQQRFAAQIAKQIDLESKKVLAQQQPVSTKGTIQLYNFISREAILGFDCHARKGLATSSRQQFIACGLVAGS